MNTASQASEAFPSEAGQRCESGDRRREPRRRVLLSGKLAFGRDLSADCSIRDESDGGARIAVGHYLIPRKLALAVLSKGTAYEAQVVWRRDNEAGLRLVRAYPMTPKDPREVPEPIWRARKLWAGDASRCADANPPQG